MNNPKLSEEVHGVGGNMEVSEVISDELIEASGSYAKWLKVVCKIVRHNGELWAV